MKTSKLTYINFTIKKRGKLAHFTLLLVIFARIYNYKKLFKFISLS